MKKNYQEAEELFRRYKEGLCTPEEKARLEAWFDLMSEKGNWNWADEEKENTGEEIRAAINHKIENGGVRRLYSRRIWFAAASVVLIICLGGLLYQNRNAISGYLNYPVYAEAKAPEGKRLKVSLSDGTIVWLNSSSRLRYPEKFNGDTRELTLLEGEAYFNVYPDKKRPFIVNAGITRTRVLGTSFNIKAYQYLKDVQVAVTQGKVSVESIYEKSADRKRKEVILLPNEQATVSKRTGGLEKAAVRTANIMDWTKGKLVFNNESLENAAIQLEHLFGVKFSFAQGELMEKRFTATFESTDKLDDVLFAISRANKLGYTRGENTVVFKQKD